MHCVRTSIYGSMFFVHVTIVKLYNCYFNYHPITHLESDFMVGWVLLKYVLNSMHLELITTPPFSKLYVCHIREKNVVQMFILNSKSHFKRKQDHISYIWLESTNMRKQCCVWVQFPSHPHWSICEQMLYLWLCKIVQDLMLGNTLFTHF